MIRDSLPVFLLLPQSITRQKKSMHHNNGKKAVPYLSFLLSRRQKTTTTTTHMRKSERERKKTVSQRQWNYYISIHDMFVYIQEEEQKYSVQ